MKIKWLYCFACGASHIFAQFVEDGNWICPNCHSTRSKSEIEAAEASWKKQDAEADNDNPE